MLTTPEHEQFRKVVRDLVENEINPYVEEWEAAGIFPAHELFPKLAAVGALGLAGDHLGFEGGETAAEGENVDAHGAQATPANSASGSTGMNCANPSSPSMNADAVSVCMSQPCATLCIHVPISETSWPDQ